MGAKRKASLTKVGERTKSNASSLGERSDGDSARQRRRAGWLDLPISKREVMSAKQANAVRKALLALDDRTPQQRLLGEPPTWRSALAQRKHRCVTSMVAQMSAGRRPAPA